VQIVIIFKRNQILQQNLQNMWSESSSVSSVNLGKKYYNSRDIEFFLRGYFLARHVQCFRAHTGCHHKTKWENASLDAFYRRKWIDYAKRREQITSFHFRLLGGRIASRPSVCSSRSLPWLTLSRN